MTKTLGAALAGAALLIAYLAVSAAAPAPKPHAKGLDCRQCHTCDNPTQADPCLTACPRHKEAVGLSPSLGPDVVILDKLEDLYVPVRFNHKVHATMAGMSKGCDACHHYTPPDSPHPACKDCHPVGIVHEDIAQPGLKGAYHRQCLGCHSEWDQDTKCEICHEKKAGGRLQGTATEVCDHSHYDPVPLLDLITFSTDFAVGDKVPFHHKNHSEKYERDCTECHMQQSCTRCHIQGGNSHPMGDLSKVNLHDTCFKCHGEQNCTECHGRDPEDLFQHSDTGWPLKAYHASLSCTACHGKQGAFQKPDPKCRTCHTDGWSGGGFKHATTGVKLNEVHGELDCDACHVNGPGNGKASCDGCHDDGRTYSKASGFGTR